MVKKTKCGKNWYFMAGPLGVKLKAFLLRWPEDPSVVADLGVPASNLSLVNSLKILEKSSVDTSYRNCKY